ncbi:acyltransferase family protein [Actinosynnema pretiosum]|uniref:Acyltransferase n=1 Tax=Actinosynnema pretiosum TaxID=42197 RepID=A0A290Z6H0_9PSEU|nr:acyltransferase [Actinosynnema pretiosum]ATE54594.1 acyltransferase [Actinosynnema pretiosum]
MHAGPLDPPRGRLDALTGARFPAALAVFAFHVATAGFFDPDSGIPAALTAATRSAGTIGVSFFFVLSGFVLTWSARPGDTWGRFARRRLVKVYPNHLVTFAVAMALFAAAGTPPATALANLLLLHAWVPDPEVFLSVNGPSWSLSCELLFYLLFPLLLRLTGRIAPHRLGRWVGGVAVVVALLPLAATHLLPAEPRFGAGLEGTALHGEPVVGMWFLYAFPPVRLLDFLLGVLVARAVLSGRWRGPGVGLAGLLVLAAYLLGLVTPMLVTVDALTALPLALLVAALAARERAGRAGALGGRLPRWLGEVSFAFYLVHQIALVLVRVALGADRRLGWAQGLSGVLAALALSLAAAALLHRFVEKPAVRRFSTARRDRADAEPAADHVPTGP